MTDTMVHNGLALQPYSSNSTPTFPNQDNIEASSFLGPFPNATAMMKAIGTRNRKGSMARRNKMRAVKGFHYFHSVLLILFSISWGGALFLLFMIDGRSLSALAIARLPQSSESAENLGSTPSKTLLAEAILAMPAVDPSTYQEYPHFERLQLALEESGFVVKLELPPKQGNYGLLELESRTVWVNPVVFELGIAQHTLVHEAVHAAQLCGSYEELSPLALGLEPPLVVQPYFMRYSGIRRLVEAEAYTVQALDNSVEYVIELLNTHCP